MNGDLDSDTRSKGGPRLRALRLPRERGGYRRHCAGDGGRGRERGVRSPSRPDPWPGVSQRERSPGRHARHPGYAVTARAGPDRVRPGRTGSLRRFACVRALRQATPGPQARPCSPKSATAAGPGRINAATARRMGSERGSDLSDDSGRPSDDSDRRSEDCAAGATAPEAAAAPERFSPSPLRLGRPAEVTAAVPGGAKARWAAPVCAANAADHPEVVRSRRLRWTEPPPATPPESTSGAASADSAGPEPVARAPPAPATGCGRSYGGRLRGQLSPAG